MQRELAQPAAVRPRYGRVLVTMARNSLVRAMTFRTNFLLETVTSLSWVCMNLAFFKLVFQFRQSIGSGWGEYQYYVFIATFQMINSLVEALFMPNMEEFSDLVQTGNLDFALLKPIDAQFIISFTKFEWSALSNFCLAFGVLCYSLFHLDYMPGLVEFVLYPVYVICGVAILYSLMIVLAAASVWLGRNQSIYDFWFYITNFSRFPMEIYSGRWGTPLQLAFTFVIPIMVVVNVPARFLAKPLHPEEWRLAVFAVFATVLSLLVSRWIFKRALENYRSTSS